MDATTHYLQRLAEANVLIRLIVPLGIALWVGYGLATIVLRNALAEIAAGTMVVEQALGAGDTSSFGVLPTSGLVADKN